MKRSKKALLEVIPPRICVTFCRATFWSRPEHSEIRFLADRSENTINTEPESHDNLCGNVKIHEIRSKWTHIGLFGLRIRHFECSRYFESNGTQADPQN